MGNYGPWAASGGSGGGGDGRGAVALPARYDASRSPLLPAIAPGGQGGSIFAKFASFWRSLPLGQAPFVDYLASPDWLRVNAGVRYANTAGLARFSSPTQVSRTLNMAVGPGGGGAVSSIPISIKRADNRTFYRWARTTAQRYPNQGRGWPRVRADHGRRMLVRAASAPAMQPYVQSQLTSLPPTTSFGSTTNVLPSPWEESIYG